MDVRFETCAFRALCVLLLWLIAVQVSQPARAGDWDGDARDSVGLYDPVAGIFFLRNLNSSGPVDHRFRFGPKKSKMWALAGDWDGDGVATVGLYAPDRSQFVLRNVHARGAVDYRIRFGSAGSGWIPITGDWNGDGIDTPGLYNPAAGMFYLRNSNRSGAANRSYRFGPRESTFLPITGDWNGDGIDTVGLYDRVRGVFALRNSHRAKGVDIRLRFGPKKRQWLPLAGDWNGDSVATVGLYDPSKGIFHIRNSHAQNASHFRYRFGPADSGWFPPGSPLQFQSALDSIQQRMLKLVNQARSKTRSCGVRGTFNATAPLEWNAKLGAAAQRHSTDMASVNFFSHTGSDGSSVGTRTAQAGYDWRSVGENIAAGYSSVDSAIAVWLNSDGHCANIMRDSYREFGSAVAEQAGSDYRIYWTQVFGAQR